MRHTIGRCVICHAAMLINHEQMIKMAAGMHVGNTGGTASDDDISCDGTIETAGGKEWDLQGYTAGASAATGYVTVVIDGTTYKLLAST